MFEALLSAFPSATPVRGGNQYTVDCDVASVEETLDFKFGETTVRVPFSDFILQEGDTCYLGAYRDDEIRKYLAIVLSFCLGCGLT
jgi:hypothetical protein